MLGPKHGKAQVPDVAMRGQHIPLLEVVMAKDRSRALYARRSNRDLRPLFRAPGQVGVPASRWGATRHGTPVPNSGPDGPPGVRCRKPALGSEAGLRLQKS
jgi:hypothetical protein